MLIPNSVFRISGAASKSPIYTHLCGVRFDRPNGKARATATDGKILVESRWKEDPAEDFPVVDGVSTAPKEGFSVTVPSESCGQAFKAAPKKPRKPILGNVVLDEQNANGKVQLCSTDLENVSRISPPSVEGTYPNTDTVWDRNIEIVRFSLDSSRLLQLVKTLEDIHGKGIRLELSVGAVDKPITVTPKTNDGIETRSLIMPLVVEK